MAFSATQAPPGKPALRVVHSRIGVMNCRLQDPTRSNVQVEYITRDTDGAFSLPEVDGGIRSSRPSAPMIPITAEFFIDGDRLIGFVKFPSRMRQSRSTSTTLFE